MNALYRSPKIKRGVTSLIILIPEARIAIDSLYFERVFIKKSPDRSTVTGEVRTNK